MSGRGGQSVVEYAILLAAVALGITVAANVCYRSFVSQAQEIESTQVIF